MLNRLPTGMLEHIRQWVVDPTIRTLPDRVLLERFVRLRDEAAFAALVKRHGPMVLAVCRRLLPQVQDNEDVFQATFLLLARQAGTIRKTESIACWLHGVACRVTANLRRSNLRRRGRGGDLPEVPQPEAHRDVSWSEMQVALDEELERLPERFRAPLVLCYLEGKTRDEAAQQLAWSIDTVRGRLARGRKLLRARLTRRGLTLTSALFAAALGPGPAPAAALPAAMFISALRSALGRQGVGGHVSASAAALAEGASRTMFAGTMKLAVGVLLGMGILGTGLGALSLRLSQATLPGISDAVESETAQDDAIKKQVDLLRQENIQLKAELSELKTDLAHVKKQLLLGDAQREPPAGETTYQGKPPSYWLALLRDRDPEFRKKAIRALAAIGEIDETVIPAIVGSTKERDNGVRAEAVKALGKVGGPKLLPAISAALEDRDASVRTAAIEILGNLGRSAESAVPALIRVLRNDKGLTSSIQAAGALAKIGPAAVPALAETLKDRDDEVRARAVVGLMGGESGALPLLVEALKDRAKGVRSGAAYTLGYVAASSREPTEIGMLFQLPASQGATGEAAQAAVAALTEALKDTDAPVRLQAARALGKIGPEARSAFPSLLLMYEGKEETASCRHQAAVALWLLDLREAVRARVDPFSSHGPGPGPQRLSPRTVLPGLIDLLRDKDPTVRLGAATLLLAIGSEAADAIPALTLAAKDEDPRVSEAARKALAFISRQR